MSEPIWTFDSKIKKLDNKLVEATESINTKIDKTANTLNTAVQFIKSDVQKELQKHLDSVNVLTENLEKNLRSEVTACKSYVDSCKEIIDISNRQADMSADLYRQHIEDCKEYINGVKSEILNELTIQEQQLNRREIVLNNTVSALSSKIDRMHFDIIDNEDNVSVTYINPDGKLEYGGFRKPVPDGQTIISTIDKKLAWKYKFDTQDFNITNDIVTARGLSLENGNHISSDKINNDLKNATYNISVLSSKVTTILDKLSTVNGYVASNNFKKSVPTEDQLFNFAISCLSTGDSRISKNDVPTSTKIKNTYDNHIWILNRTYINGLTRSKWEDFGSDTVCVASNDGVHGLVTGSQERYMGFVDLQGRITINGLQEDITEILKSIEKINTDLTKIQLDFSAKLNDIEDRLSRLEA